MLALVAVRVDVEAARQLVWENVNGPVLEHAKNIVQTLVLALAKQDVMARVRGNV